jgi:hypothetical protein
VTGTTENHPSPALHWLEGVPSATSGTTWGVPWAPGQLHSSEQVIMTGGGEGVPLDSWTTARWPDGSIKWTGHAVGALAAPAESYRLEIGEPPEPAAGITVTETPEAITVDTGVATMVINTSGPTLIAELRRGETRIAAGGRLISLLQTTPGEVDEYEVRRIPFTGQVTSASVEWSGTQRVVIKLEGRHRADRPDDHDDWLPFVVRLYCYAGSHAVRLVHTLIWNGDEQTEFLAGLGLRFEVDLRDALHDRHLRIAGADGGFLTEAVRGLTGLRRDPGEAVREAQLAGRPTPDVETWDPAASSRLEFIPAWGDYTLSQLSSDGFTLRKRTKAGHGWIGISTGTRSDGFAYLGGIGGGLGVALRDFWQSYPTQLDLRNAATDTGQITVWLHSPEAPVMDLRFYHDGLGEETYEDQLSAMEITYEDHEPGFGTPYGIARTSELTLWAYDSTPESATLARDSAQSQRPPLLATAPDYLHGVGVFGDWAPVDRSTPERAAIEDRLDFLFDFYAGQREQRRWYGFWNYGDVMHSYDADRHVWRYDVGGFAWDNSELSTDLWLWYSYLRTGRSDIFRFAEAMTRHTGEVDVYHAGKWRGLGSRHNVQHWGCSAKQHRISNPLYRRFYYYLTADERVGDLMAELIDSDQRLMILDSHRKVRTDGYRPGNSEALSVMVGLDFGAFAATWLTAWERADDGAARDKLLATMRDVGALANGFLTGELRYDLDRGRFDTEIVRIHISHLNAVFGLVETCSELIALADRFDLDIGGFADAWLQYCRLFLAPPEVQRAEAGAEFPRQGLVQGHSRLLAYAAHRLVDDQLAADAWAAFLASERIKDETFGTHRVDGPAVLQPIDEAAMIPTNGTAQYGLAAIQNLALIGDQLPGHHPS